MGGSSEAVGVRGTSEAGGVIVRRASGSGWGKWRACGVSARVRPGSCFLFHPTSSCTLEFFFASSLYSFLARKAE
jgi:hypothetical protein